MLKLWLVGGWRLAMVKQSITGSGEPFHALREAVEARRRHIQEGVLSWATNNFPRYPWRQSGKTPYEVLIGEAWLKQTSSSVAVRVYQRFVQQFLSIKALSEAEEGDVTDVCCSFGLERPAQYIKMMVKSLLKEGKGELPRNSETFAKASGLEHQHVKSIFCFGYGMPIAVVDVNVARMLSRLFRHAIPSPPAQGLLQAIGESLLPFGNPQSYNGGLLDLAELICRDIDPLCHRCPIGEVCDYAEALPQRKNPYPALFQSTSV